jgi:CheY-like chemotaxis protein
MDGLTFIVLLVVSLLFGLFIIFSVLHVIVKSQRATVLLIDDNKNILEQLRDFLKERNYLVYTAETVEEAKRLICEKGLESKYIVIDLEMPANEEKYIKGGCSWGGVEIFNFVKSNFNLITPIIVSSYQLKKLRNDGFEKEADEMIKYFVYKDKAGHYILSVLKMLRF